MREAAIEHEVEHRLERVVEPLCILEAGAGRLGDQIRTTEVYSIADRPYAGQAAGREELLEEREDVHVAKQCRPLMAALCRTHGAMRTGQPYYKFATTSL